MEPELTLIALNDVLADRADEFEEWLRTVVVPASNERRPQIRGRYRVLRATEVEDGVVVFAFVCVGGRLEDYELDPILEETLGPDGAGDALATFAGMLRGGQRSWVLTRFPSATLTGPASTA